MPKYPISSYNKYVCLKANDLMIVIILYLMKPFLLALFSIVNRKDRSALINMFYPDKILLSFEALAAVPILFLFIAWMKRSPDTGERFRLIWKNGKKIIMAVAMLQLIVTTSPLWLQGDLAMTNSSWVQSALYILIIVVTPFSTYMNDCFADFPDPSDEKLSKK